MPEPTEAKGRSQRGVTALKAPESRLRAGEPRVDESREMGKFRALGQQADRGAAWEHAPGTPRPAAPRGQILQKKPPSLFAGDGSGVVRRLSFSRGLQKTAFSAPVLFCLRGSCRGLLEPQETSCFRNCTSMLSKPSGYLVKSLHEETRPNWPV